MADLEIELATARREGDELQALVDHQDDELAKARHTIAMQDDVIAAQADVIAVFRKTIMRLAGDAELVATGVAS